MGRLRAMSIVAFGLTAAAAQAQPVSPGVAVEETPANHITRLNQCFDELAPDFDARVAANRVEMDRIRDAMRSASQTERRALMTQWREAGRARPKPASLLAATLNCGTAPVAVEPLSDMLSFRIRTEIEDVLNRMWRRGDFAWTLRVDQAYFVRCGLGVAIQDEIARGLLVCNIGAAYLRPSEFDIIRIEIKTADAQQ